MFASQFAGYWRDGKRVAMDRNASLPDRCVKCNEPAEGYRRAVKLTYVPLGTHLMLRSGDRVRLRETSDGRGGAMRASPALRSMTAALVSVAAIVLSILALAQVQATDPLVPLLATAGLIGGVIGLLYAGYPRRAVRATKITDTHLWLKGAGEPFLASLPDAPPASAGGALPTIQPAATVPADPAVAANAAFQGARNGALTFLAGCIVTAGSYAFLTGRYFIVWGAVLFGLIRLVRGVRTYVSVPAEQRNMGQVLVLVGSSALV